MEGLVDWTLLDDGLTREDHYSCGQEEKQGRHGNRVKNLLDFLNGG